MGYIGQQLPADVFSGFTIDKFTGDGTANKALTLSKAPFSETTVLVTIDGVVQEPTDDFTVSGTTLTLVGTAANGSEINVTHLSGTVPSTLASKVDLNGVSDTLILDADADTTISADTDDQIDFKTGGTDRLKVQSTSGNNVVVADGLTLTDGNLVVASGHGISFAATSDASGMSSELLDDYEEGTFTPVFSGTSGAVSGANYSNQAGFYTKIGRHVYFSLYLVLASFSSAPSGTLIITGLPFTSLNSTNNYSAANFGYSNEFISTDAPQTGFVGPNASQITCIANQSNDARDDLRTSVNAGNLDGDEVVIVSGHYLT
jgi:hypothetical protein